MVGPAREKGLGQDQVTLLDEQEETSKVNVSCFVEHPQFSHGSQLRIVEEGTERKGRLYDWQAAEPAFHPGSWNEGTNLETMPMMAIPAASTAAGVAGGRDNSSVHTG